MHELVNKYGYKSKDYIREKFARDGAGWLLLQQVLIAPISLFTTVLLAHILSIENYGYYKYVLSMYNVIGLFSFGGIYTISMMNIQRGEDNFFSLGFKYKKYLRWIPSILSLIIAIYYFHEQNNFLAVFFIINILSYLIVDTYDFYLVALQGKGDFKSNAIFGIFYYFISFIPPIITAYYTQNLYLVFITMYTFQALFRLFTFRYVKNKLEIFNKKEIPVISKEKEKEFKKQIVSSSFNSALSTAGVNLSSIVVFNRLGAFDNAIYSLALTFADFVGGIMLATSTKIQLLLSRMTKDNGGYNQDSDILKIKYIKSTFKKYFWLSFFAMIICMSILPFVYKILFAKYFFSYKYAVIYSLGLLSITFMPASFFFVEKRDFKIINVIQILTLILNIIMIFFSSMYFGVFGAILVAVIMKYITNLTYVVMMRVKKNQN